MSSARMIAAETSVNQLERSGGRLRARHALAHVEHLDADHPAVAVEIEHDAWRPSSVTADLTPSGPNQTNIASASGS